MRGVLLAAGLLSLVGSASAGSGVQTIFRNPTGPIASFAQDGTLLAFFAAGPGHCNSVHVLSLRGVEATLPKPRTHNVTCRWTIGRASPRLALAAGRGAELWTLHESASLDLDYVVGADVKQPRERRLAQLSHTHAGAGLWLGGIAGDGSTLAYSRAVVRYVDQVACLSGGSCRRRIAGGGVHVLEGRRSAVVPGTRAALQLSVAAGRLAYVRATAVSADGRPVATARASIEVREAHGGALVAAVRPDGIPLALSLSRRRLAVLARSRGRLHVSWYDTTSGRRLGRVGVPGRTTPQLSASDRFAVFHVGRLIEAVDFASHRAHKLVRAAATPIGLSLEGRRVAWAENVRGIGRIRALFLNLR